MNEKKGFFVVPKVSPWCPNHVTICLRHSVESLQNGQLELRRWNWYFTWETHKDTAVSVWARQAGFWKSTGTSCQLRSKPHVVFHGVCEIALTEVLATQMGVMRHFAYLKTLDFYFNTSERQQQQKIKLNHNNSKAQTNKQKTQSYASKAQTNNMWSQSHLSFFNFEQMHG